MDLAITYRDSKESLIDYAVMFDMHDFVHSVMKGMKHSALGEVVEDYALKRNGKYKAKAEFKPIFKKILQCFPDEVLEKHHLHQNARVADNKPTNLLSNNEIHDLWKTKRTEKKRRDQVLTGIACMKRKNLNRDTIENIAKRMK
jgi:hypothetical protein